MSVSPGLFPRSTCASAGIFGPISKVDYTRLCSSPVFKYQLVEHVLEKVVTSDIPGFDPELTQADIEGLRKTVRFIGHRQYDEATGDMMCRIRKAKKKI